MKWSRLKKAITWRLDVEQGEMIEAAGYRKDYMGFKGSISQKELNAICEASGKIFEALGSDLRIGNSMGELRPGFTAWPRTGSHPRQE